MSTTFYVRAGHLRGQVASLPRVELTRLAPILDPLYRCLDDPEKGHLLTKGLYEVGATYAAGRGIKRVQWAWPNGDFWNLLPKDTKIEGNDPEVRTLGDLVMNDPNFNSTISH